MWLILLILCGCSPTSPPSKNKETYQGRSQKHVLYHAEVPLHWKRIEPVGDLSDTRIPICSYEMEEGLLTIHTFENRIPPEEQVERWKQQTGECEITPFAYGGFGGYRLESDTMLAYALQLTPLLFQSCPLSELKADYTLKFIGSVEKNRNAIDAFAASFEWIQPILYEDL